MRNLLLSIAATLLFMACSVEQANAQTVAQTIKGTWKGTATFATDFVQGGTATLNHTVTINVYGGTNVTGKVITLWKLNGQQYKSQSTISGKVFEDDNKISFHCTISPGGDNLPHDLKWCSLGGDLTLYADPKHPGYYILSGVGKEKCNWGAATFTYSNYK